MSQIETYNPLTDESLMANVMSDTRADHAEIKRLREALEKISGGHINSDFVMSNPPDWHSAFTQFQAIAREALGK